MRRAVTDEIGNALGDLIRAVDGAGPYKAYFQAQEPGQPTRARFEREEPPTSSTTAACRRPLHESDFFFEFDDGTMLPITDLAGAVEKVVGRLTSVQRPAPVPPPALRVAGGE